MNLHILGTGITPFGELWDKSLRDLAEAAMAEAVHSAQLDPTDIEAIFVANMAAGSFSGQRHLGALLAEWFPHHPPAMRVEGACASGGLAMIAAEQSLLSGQYQTVLVVGVEKMTDVDAAYATQVLASAANRDAEPGVTFPALYALLAQAYQQQYAVPDEVRAAVAVKNHAHALSNPLAQFRKALTVATVLQSPAVADPLRLLDCSPLSDGAAAVVLSTKSQPRAPRVRGFGQGSDSVSLAGRTTLTSLPATLRAARAAFSQASLQPQDIPVAEVHDCFTIAELLALEDLGFCEPGTAGGVTMSGLTTHPQVREKFLQEVAMIPSRRNAAKGYSLPLPIINPSGGLKACGHPVGATGVKQVAFLARLLKNGEYPYALAHNVGGSGATSVVHILESGDTKSRRTV